MTRAGGTRVIGLAGWSGAGKTTLLARLIPALVAQGLRVCTIKRAHHGFEVDHPGKDSFVHREAGAAEVIVSSPRRWVHIHEGAGEPEARLADLLRLLSPCDLVLVEGYKREAHAKLEVFRKANGRPALHPGDDRIVAIASDQAFPDAKVPVVPLDDVPQIANRIRDWAEPIETALERLSGTAH